MKNQSIGIRFQALFLVLPLLLPFLGGCPSGPDKVALPSEAPPVAPIDSQNSQGSQNPQLSQGREALPVDSTQSAAESGTPASIEGQEKRSSVALSPESRSRISGQVVSAQQGQMGFKVGGHISEVKVKVGEMVQKGQVLAELDSADSVLRSRFAAGQVEQAKIAFEQARRDFDREVQLKKEGATTEISFERATNAQASAKIALSSAEISYSQAKKAENDSRLTAPFDGVVSKRFKVEGEYVGVGAPVIELSASSDLEVSLRVPESLFRKIKIGEKVPLSIPSIGKETEITIDRIVPVIQESTRTFEVIGKFGPDFILSDRDIAPGLFAEARFVN